MLKKSTDGTRWSMKSLEWLESVRYHHLLKKSNNEYYPIQTVIRGGEKLLIDGERHYRLDGFAMTSQGPVIFEFLGCRYHKW